MDLIAEWRTLPRLIDDMLAATGEAALDQPIGPAELGMTRRQVVHHIAEANVVAASIIVAALGSPGSTYDWSWMMPFGAWVERLGYAQKPIEPARRVLAALVDYVAAQIEPLPGALERDVWLRDEPHGDLRRATVADILRQEIDHAREHLGQPGSAPT